LLKRDGSQNLLDRRFDGWAPNQAWTSFDDTPANRRLAGKYIEIFQFPDGRIEIRVAAQSLPYSTYDKLGHIDSAAVIESHLVAPAAQQASPQLRTGGHGTQPDRHEIS
jgi:hypothetical protein